MRPFPGYLLAWAIVAAASVACGRNFPEPPIVTPGPPATVTGTERLGWTQRVADAQEMSTFRYAIYVDGTRGELADVSCQPPSPSSTDVDCSAPLPAMPPGSHTIELATFIADGEILESVRSAPLQVIKTAPAAVGRPEVEPTWPDGLTATTADATRLVIRRVAEGLNRPVDIAFLPDGRALVAEESGRVQMLLPGRGLAPEPALSVRPERGDERMLAIAVDAQFDRTRFVYAIGTTTASTGAGAAFTLSRFREASNVLTDRTVIRDGIPASAGTAAASLRAAGDGTLFAAFDDGDNPRNAGDLASPNGKILRLNGDGTTPRDQSSATPVYSAGFRSPRGLDWRPASNLLWIADALPENGAQLSAISTADDRRTRGERVASYTLPRGTVPSSAAFYRGTALPSFRDNLLIASNEGRHLLRVRFDSTDQTKVLGTERLLQNAIGGIRAVAVTRDGTIYVATANAVAAITAAR